MLLIARLIADEASCCVEPVPDPLCLLAFDIKKAYPNTSRTIADEVLRRLGITEKTHSLLSGLHATTQYIVVTGLGKSKAYNLNKGFREGCPSSCTCYNLVHNVGLWLLTQGPDSLSLQGVNYQAADETRPLTKQRRKTATTTTASMTASASSVANSYGQATGSVALSHGSTPSSIARSNGQRAAVLKRPATTTMKRPASATHNSGHSSDLQGQRPAKQRDNGDAQTQQSAQLALAPTTSNTTAAALATTDHTLRILGFAVDTSAITRLSQTAAVEKQLIHTFAQLGEEVHAGKTERILFDPNTKTPDGFVDNLRLVGGWLSQDGTAHYDTSERTQAARLVWRRLHR